MNYIFYTILLIYTYKAWILEQDGRICALKNLVGRRGSHKLQVLSKNFHSQQHSFNFKYFHFWKFFLCDMTIKSVRTDWLFSRYFPLSIGRFQFILIWQICKIYDCFSVCEWKILWLSSWLLGKFCVFSWWPISKFSNFLSQPIDKFSNFILRLIRKFSYFFLWHPDEINDFFSASDWKFCFFSVTSRQISWY